VLCEVSIKPPGLTLDKDEGDEGVSGINVRRFVERREGKGCSGVCPAGVATLKSNS
jgi:hypothetical protein